MNVRQTLRAAAAALEEAGVPDPRVDAEQLLSHVTGVEPLWLRLEGDREVTPEQEAAFRALLSRRLSREPLQYLLGNAWFCGRAFQVDTRALIPRPETCMLPQLALERCGQEHSLRALDLCTGSGCIAITLKLERPAWEVDACDLSHEALALAAENARGMGADVPFFQGDLFRAVSGRYQLILSNPPYIPDEACRSLQPEVMREPRMALDGGSDGLDFYRRIAREAPAHMAPGALLLLEAGWGEAGAICALLAEAGFTEIRTHRDFQQIERAVEARWKTTG